MKQKHGKIFAMIPKKKWLKYSPEKSQIYKFGKRPPHELKLFKIEYLISSHEKFSAQANILT